jgi:hypothetical protein
MPPRQGVASSSAESKTLPAPIDTTAADTAHTTNGYGEEDTMGTLKKTFAGIFGDI